MHMQAHVPVPPLFSFLCPRRVCVCVCVSVCVVPGAYCIRLLLNSTSVHLCFCLLVSCMYVCFMLHVCSCLSLCCFVYHCVCVSVCLCPCLYRRLLNTHTFLCACMCIICFCVTSAVYPTISGLHYTNLCMCACV